MKKLPVLLILVSGLLLASCGRSGWNCKNRYCETPTEKELKTPKQKNNIPT